MRDISVTITFPGFSSSMEGRVPSACIPPWQRHGNCFFKRWELSRFPHFPLLPIVLQPPTSFKSVIFWDSLYSAPMHSTARKAKKHQLETNRVVKWDCGADMDLGPDMDTIRAGIWEDVKDFRNRARVATVATWTSWGL